MANRYPQLISCLFDTIRDENEIAIRLMLNLHNLDINDNSSQQEYYGTPLHVATTTNNANIVRLIISLGGDVNAVDYYGATPLYTAIVENRSLEVIKVLLESGSDIYKEAEAVNGFNTPFSLANSKARYKQIYEAMIPYTKGHKKWKKVRIVAKIIGAMMIQYKASIENVWRPGGTGFDLAKENFNALVYA